MQRIVIVGATGAGKTTLANKLSSQLKCPVVDLDEYYWQPGWMPNDTEVFRDKTAQAISDDSWVSAGNYRAVRDILWNNADTVIWLDYSFWLTFKRLAQRTFLRLRDKNLVCNGNRESFRQFFSKDNIILFLMTSYADKRRQYRQIFAVPGNYPTIKNFIHLKSPQEAEKFINGLQA